MESSSAGNYSCVAANEYGLSTRTVWVDVMKPPRIRISSNEITAVEGAAVSVSCEVENSNAEYPTRWLNGLGEVLTNVIAN